MQRVFDTLPDVDASGRRALASSRIKEDIEAVQFATPVHCTVGAWRWEKLGVCSYSVITATTAFLAKHATNALGFTEISLASVLLTVVVVQFFPPIVIQFLRLVYRAFSRCICCHRSDSTKSVICAAVTVKLADLVNRRSLGVVVDALPVEVTADPFVCFVSMMWLNALRDVSSVLEVEQWRLDLWAEIAAESGGSESPVPVVIADNGPVSTSEVWHDVREAKVGKACGKDA
jgi:hypothetical protein